MSDMFNKAIFCGRVAGEVKLTKTAKGTSRAVFTLAYNYGYGENKESCFLMMKAFGKRAELLANSCPKGTKMIVECQVRPFTYEKDGKKLYSTDFWVQQMELCGDKLRENDAWNKPIPGSENAVLPGTRPVNGSSDDFVTVPDGIEDEMPFM